jgi:hypothetical protein
MGVGVLVCGLVVCNRCCEGDEFFVFFCNQSINQYDGSLELCIQPVVSRLMGIEYDVPLQLILVFAAGSLETNKIDLVR